MDIPKRHSTLLSLGAVMATITLLALTSMAASLFIADTIQGEATAINESGALRMRSYKIASSLLHEFDNNQHSLTTYQLIKEFERNLISADLTSVIPSDDKHEIRIAYNHIEQQWRHQIEPLFQIYHANNSSAQSDEIQSIHMEISKETVIDIRNRYFEVVPDFVNNIDYLVSLLEEDAETKIKQLRLYQYIALTITTLLLLTAIMLVYNRVHVPMKQLLRAAKHASNRDFSFKTTYTGTDELGKLGQAYNDMANDLSEIYEELEDRVQQKTNDLERSNRSIEILYKTVKRLNEAVSPQSIFPFILDDIEKLLSTGQGSICLNDQSQNEATMLSTSLSGNNYNKIICDKQTCNKCLNSGSSQLFEIKDEEGKNNRYISIPICNQNKQYGVLIVEAGSNKSFDAWKQQLLQSIADQIGIAISLSNKAVESRRYDLLEERGVIARELHDSLAQSLTFMKIQVSRLNAILKNSDIEVEAGIVVAELRVGLNSAYRELRELLTTFRLKFEGDDFKSALNKTISEFNSRSDTNINCDNRITYFNLTPNEEIHLLQLIREALSNILQHADACSAKVLLKYDNSGNIALEIEDDGVGLPLDSQSTHHYGLSIMKERAKTLNGNYIIERGENGGTIIKLYFSPTNISAPINKTGTNEIN